MWFWFWLGTTLLLGLVVGSFLNVCIWRMPREMSVAQPPSHCPACETRLRPWDLVPVLSFLLQGRKCRYCKAPISWRYAVVETLTGAAFVLAYLVDGVGAPLFFDAVMIAALIAIFAIDLEHYIIPDELNLLLVMTGIGREVWGRVATGQWAYPIFLPIPWTEYQVMLPASVVGLVASVLLFLGMGLLGEWLFKREALGFGDVKLAAGLGAHLGLLGALSSYLIAIVLGAVVGIALIACGLRKRAEYIPFGPAMVLGALAVIYAGQWVVPWLLDLYQVHLASVPVRSWP